MKIELDFIINLINLQIKLIMKSNSNSKQVYKHKSKLFGEYIFNNVNIIVLVGSGSNGKSYLTNEFSRLLNVSGYEIISPDVSYIWEDGQLCKELCRDNKHKKVVHVQFISDHNYNTLLQKNSKSLGIIDMNNIKF